MKPDYLAHLAFQQPFSSVSGRIDLSSCSSFVGSFDIPKDDIGIQFSLDTMMTH